jgi:hypothetical protein
MRKDDNVDDGPAGILVGHDEPHAKHWEGHCRNGDLERDSRSAFPCRRLVFGDFPKRYENRLKFLSGGW